MLTKDDAADAVRLAVRQAGTYDAETKTGGFNASIILNADELARPENAPIRPFVEKLKKVKAAIDEKCASIGAPPISYSDTLVLAVKLTCRDKWTTIKSEQNGLAADQALSFSAPWPVVLGRVDSSETTSKSLPADDAPVADIKSALASLGKADPSPFAPKPPFWDKPAYLVWCGGAKDEAGEEARFVAADPAFASIKKSYDVSRATVTRTNYEVDFINFITRAFNLGTKIDSTVYLYPIEIRSI
eukprot:gene10122-8022_t